MTNEPKVDWSNAQVGDDAWSIVRGKGRVVGVTSGVGYPVKIKFDDGTSNTYSVCGRGVMESVLPTLFHAPFALSDIPAACITPPKRKVKKVAEWWFYTYREDITRIYYDRDKERCERFFDARIADGTAISKTLHHIREEYEVEA